MSRDYQKAKVYAWENAILPSRCTARVPFENAQAFVDGVWLSLGKLGPPRVELISTRCTKIWAYGCRSHIAIPADCPAWVVLHELAHSLTMDHDGNGDRHGRHFVAVYMRLLDKVLNVPLCLLIYSAQQHGVKFDQPY